MENEALMKTVKLAGSIFFDFDGPICEVFAGLPASEVAKNLADAMRRFDPILSERMQGMDFVDALRVSPEGGEGALKAIEETLISAEIAAVKVAGEPTPGAVASLQAARSSGRNVAIVSNNSAECVREFLNLHELTSLVHEVVGRPPHEPHRMKPAPDSVLVAAARFGARPQSCTLVGDSVTDVVAAIAAGSTSIGYANRAGKEKALTRAGADAVIDSMAILAEALARFSA
ncbi:HAD family hydrolase [Streptomyces sp. NPDC087420]|uniref:HAD family hydrolase n=1 Tax=Streptomyces sp. NPDC087420 TaxID=3365785 RepID=UPI003838148B